MKKKLIYINIPCFNEEENIEPLVDAIKEIFNRELQKYDYIIQFNENCSSDNTRNVIRNICEKNKHVRAIFSGRNMKGKTNRYGLIQAEGDCVINMVADFQDPVELIPVFVKEWEKGNCIVCGIKTSSNETKLLYKVRTLFYWIMRKMTDGKFIEQFSGFCLFDKKFVDFVKTMKDQNCSLRGIVAEYGYDIVNVPYHQPKRRAGKSSNNLFTLYNTAMKNFVVFSQGTMRIACLSGLILSIIMFIIGFIYLIMKLLYWNRFQAGLAPVLIGIFFIGAIQLFFIGLLGEYVMGMKEHIINNPLILEECRINFPNSD